MTEDGLRFDFNHFQAMTPEEIAAVEDVYKRQMKNDPLKEYLKASEPDQVSKGYIWRTAIGLQAVDGLNPSRYLIDTAIQNIEGKITVTEARDLIDGYYKANPVELSADERTEEADKVSSRIAEILAEPAFSFSPNEYIGKMCIRDRHWTEQTSIKI